MEAWQRAFKLLVKEELFPLQDKKKNKLHPFSFVCILIFKNCVINVSDSICAARVFSEREMENRNNNKRVIWINSDVRNRWVEQTTKWKLVVCRVHEGKKISDFKMCKHSVFWILMRADLDRVYLQIVHEWRILQVTLFKWWTSFHIRASDTRYEIRISHSPWLSQFNLN